MAEKQTKYIFVTGGVVSGLGKGITAASLGRLLKCRGLKVASQKLDPYVNVDPGTMSPLQHGEVFVTDDGTETDLDLGHYERFIDENLNKYSNLTTGKVYWNVLNKERQGAYLGQTVQIIPHITNEIKSYIYNMASSTGADVVITEIGGTTGDIESQPFLEAIRQVGLEQGRDNCCFIHVVLVPYISGSNEYKSKPAQHSVKELQGMGVNPDIIILRADGSVGTDIRRKISTFCNVKPECVIENLTMPSLYQCPLMLHTNGLDDVVVNKLQLDVPPADLTEWKQVVSRIATRSKTCTIALVGKYVKLHDAYLSVMESLYHAGFENDSQVEIKWVESEDLTDQNACKELFADVDGIIVPGGFGDRGIEGMIQAAQYARENNVPYFGICLGMQIMVMEFAGVCWATPTPIPASSPRTASTTSSPSWPTSRATSPRAAPCVWASTPAPWPPAPRWPSATARPRSGSVTATATSSTTTSGRRCRTPVWSFPAPARTAVWWRRWSCPAAPSIWVPSSTRSSRAAPTAPIPCSGASSRRRSSSAPVPSAA